MIHLTYYGHSCFSVEIEEKTILFDPYITANPLASHIDVKSIKPDYIFITHGHEDHVADVELFAKQSGAKVVANFEIAQWFIQKGLEGVLALNHGGALDLPFGKVKYVYAFHSSTLPDGSNGGHPGGYVVQSKLGTFYYAGDTALSYEMKMIKEFFNVDFAVLPIGGTFTMDASDAAICAEWVGTKRVVGVHYDTFEPIKIDQAAAKAPFIARGYQLMLPDIGETLPMQ